MVLKGPLERIVLREKQKVAGIWMNVERVRFRSAPSFLRGRLVAAAAAAWSTSAPPRSTSSASTISSFRPAAAPRPTCCAVSSAGLIELRRRSQLYAEYPRGVEISEGVLYRARIAIPARVPVGTYTAETFLIRDGRVIAGAAREIRIEKLGFEGFVANAAEHWSLTYGIVCVALSLLLGWAASALFQRRYAEAHTGTVRNHLFTLLL